MSELEDFEAKLRNAEADLAFALAQGDGYAEDDAAQRIKDLKAAIDAAERVKDLKTAIERLNA